MVHKVLFRAKDNKGNASFILTEETSREQKEPFMPSFMDLWGLSIAYNIRGVLIDAINQSNFIYMAPSNLQVMHKVLSKVKDNKGIADKTLLTHML